jgi:SAM-dependent methyltransferase
MPNPPRQIDRLLEWTGERCVPWVDDWQVVYEHLHRYYFAADLADGRRVLDLGSGEGYGSAILAERAKEVLGIELDSQAVEHASTNYPFDNLEFRQASVLELDDLPDASFDLVICYEVIEHIIEHDELLALVRRVLAPDGLFVVSTPDREIYSEATDYHNPYHVKELSRPELDHLLTRFFSHHGLWGQTVTVGSTLRRLDRAPGSGAVDEIFVRKEGDRWMRHQPGPVPYVVAVASQSQLAALPDFSLLNDPEAGALRAPPPPAPASFGEAVSRELDQGTGRLFELWEPERLRRQAEIFEAAVASEIGANQTAREEIADLHRRLEAVNSALDVARHEIDVLRNEGAEAGHAARRAEDEIASLHAQLDDITRSRAWRTLSRYRLIRAAFSGRAHRPGA